MTQTHTQIQGFTEADVAFILSFAESLGRCKLHGHWFRKITRAEIEFESIEFENDTLLIRECSLQKIEADAGAIVPRKQIMYSVQIPMTTPGTGYWEPEDVDMVEVARLPGLAEAFGEFYMQAVQNYLRDVSMAIDYEQTKQALEEV